MLFEPDECNFDQMKKKLFTGKKKKRTVTHSLFGEETNYIAQVKTYKKVFIKTKNEHLFFGSGRVILTPHSRTDLSE